MINGGSFVEPSVFIVSKYVNQVLFPLTPEHCLSDSPWSGGMVDEAILDVITPSHQYY